MSNAKHTPGPPFFMDTSLHIYGTNPPVRKAGEDYERIEQPHIATAPNWAAANLIVTALNTHADMAEALKKMLSAFAWECEGSGNVRDDAVTEARAALAKAGVE